MKPSRSNRYDDLTMIERRVLHLVGARLRDVNRIHRAIRKQDEMRIKHTKVRGWKSVEQIRKWRENR